MYKYTRMHFQNKKQNRRFGVGLVVVYSAAFLLNIVLSSLIAEMNSVHAGGFTNVAMRHSRMVVNHAASGTDPILVIAKATTTGTELSLGISFDAGYTINATPANITVTTTGIPATYQGLTLTAWPGIGSAATAVSGQNVTFASTDLTVATNTYAFFITGGVTSPATTGQKIHKISTHSDATPDFSGYTDAIDASRIAVYTVADNGSGTDGDQIVVTAKVPPTYTFALSANSITLDTEAASVQYPGGTLNGAVPVVTVTATTNANNGHAMWLKSGTSSGLTSTIAGGSIAFAGTAADATPATLSAGTEGVVVDVNLNTNTSGSLAVSAEFDGASTSAGGTPSTTFQEIATASGPAGTAGDKVDIVPRVAISAITQAADDYTQTFTVIGAGNF